MTGEPSLLNPGDWLNIPAALELLPVGKSLLYRLVGERQVEAIRVGGVGSRRGRWLVSRRGLEDYIARRLEAMRPRELKADPDAILARIRGGRRGV